MKLRITVLILFSLQINFTFSQNINYFTEFVRKDDIGKNSITNPYNTGDKSIINQVDTTVLTINNRISLINYDLTILRKALPNNEENLTQLKYRTWKIDDYYTFINLYDFYKVVDREKVSRILKNYTYSNLIELSSYNVFLFKKKGSDHVPSYTYFYQIIDNKNNRLDGRYNISEDDFEKLERKSLIEHIDENLKIDFLFDNWGSSEIQYLNFELFTTLLQDSIKNSIYKQDILGYTYIGQVENGTRSGFGTLVNLFQDTIYKGIWKDDMPYQGQFYQFNYENKCFGNCENGIGLMITNTNCVYRGGVKDGKWEGKGEYIFIPSYDDSYNNYMTSTYTNGEEGVDRKSFTLNAIKSENNNLIINKYYNGDIFFYSKKEDEDGSHKALRLFNNGSIFSGYLTDNGNKKGDVYYQNGDIFIGSSLNIGGNNEKSGIWIELNSDGTCDKLLGQFINGKLNGMGAIYYANGNVSEGLFDYGMLVKTSNEIEDERLSKIEDERLLKIKEENKEEEKRRSDGLAAMELLATLFQYQKEYENSPEGKAKKYQLENYCGWCNGKIAQRKFKPCYDGSRQQGQCYSSLYDGKPSFLSYEYGQEFFCSPGCAINSCQNKH